MQRGVSLCSFRLGADPWHLSWSHGSQRAAAPLNETASFSLGLFQEEGHLAWLPHACLSTLCLWTEHLIHVEPPWAQGQSPWKADKIQRQAPWGTWNSDLKSHCHLKQHVVDSSFVPKYLSYFILWSLQITGKLKKRFRIKIQSLIFFFSLFCPINHWVLFTFSLKSLAFLLILARLADLWPVTPRQRWASLTPTALLLGKIAGSHLIKHIQVWIVNWGLWGGGVLPVWVLVNHIYNSLLVSWCWRLWIRVLTIELCP